MKSSTGLSDSVVGAFPNIGCSILSESDSNLDYEQTLLLPPNQQDFVPKGHVLRFIVELVRESLDLREITDERARTAAV